MTSAQKFKFYFPAWTDAVRANGWRMEHGRLAVAASRESAETKAVLNFARRRAAAEHRGPVVDDLRHGAHLFALGRDKSSTDLTNAEVDRVVTLFRLLADPDDLSARMAWDQPEEEQRKGFVRYLRTLAPEATLRAIARNAFDTADWPDLDGSKLKWLIRELKERHARKSDPALVPAGEPDPDWDA